MIQCGQTSVKSPILFPYRGTAFSFPKTEGLGHNTDFDPCRPVRTRNPSALCMPFPRWSDCSSAPPRPPTLVSCPLFHLRMGRAPAGFELLTPDLGAGQRREPARKSRALQRPGWASYHQKAGMPVADLARSEHVSDWHKLVTLAADPQAPVICQ